MFSSSYLGSYLVETGQQSLLHGLDGLGDLVLGVHADPGDYVGVRGSCGPTSLLVTMGLVILSIKQGVTFPGGLRALPAGNFGISQEIQPMHTCLTTKIFAIMRKVT